MKREDVYKLIDGEREYQKKLRTLGEQGFPVEEEMVLLRVYLRKAEDIYAETFGDPKEVPTMNVIRKIAGICVRCMEYHDTPAREA